MSWLQIYHTLLQLNMVFQIKMLDEKLKFNSILHNLCKGISSMYKRRLAGLDELSEDKIFRVGISK